MPRLDHVGSVVTVPALLEQRSVERAERQAGAAVEDRGLTIVAGEAEVVEASSPPKVSNVSSIGRERSEKTQGWTAWASGIAAAFLCSPADERRCFRCIS